MGADETALARLDRNGRSVIALVGDLTRQDADAVVNAANEQLAHGGGVAAALARAGGSEVQAESDRWVAAHGELRPGTAAVTTAGDMPARMLVHVVGPRYRKGQDNEGLLRQAVQAALDAARNADARSVALPAISAGIFGYPLQDASSVIADACAQWLDDEPGSVQEIRLVGFDQHAADCFSAGLGQR